MGVNTSGLKRTAGPGRPKGSKSKLTKDLLAFGRDVLESHEWQAAARARMVKGKAPHLEKYFVERLCGKPKETVDVTSAGRPLFALPPGTFVKVSAEE